MKLKVWVTSLIFIPIIFAKFTFYKLDNKITKRSQCPKKSLAKLHEKNKYVHPYEIVFKPLQGRHNVHGIFMLPIEDKSLKILVVSVPGAGTFCGGAHNVGMELVLKEYKQNLDITRSKLTLELGLLFG